MNTLNSTALGLSVSLKDRVKVVHGSVSHEALEPSTFNIQGHDLATVLSMINLTLW